MTDSVSVNDAMTLSDMEASLDVLRGESQTDIDFDVVGSADDIIANASELVGATKVTVNDGAVDVSDGLQLSQLEADLISDDSNSDVLFSVSDSASAVVDALSDVSAISTIENITFSVALQTYGNVKIEQHYTDENGNTQAETLSDAPGGWSGAQGKTNFSLNNVEIYSGATFTLTLNNYDNRNDPAISELGGYELSNHSSFTENRVVLEEKYTEAPINSAEAITVDSGETDVAGAELIQNNARYQEDASSYDLKDSAGAVLSSTETAMDNGVDDIIITDPFVNASEGVALTQLEEQHAIKTGDSTDEVQFRVEDDAEAIATALISSSGALNGADELEVTSGTASYDQAVKIQNVSGYDDTGSAYTISDTAGAILNASADVLSDSGVSQVIANEVATAQDALSLSQDGNVDEYNLTAGFNDVTDLTLEEALAIVDASGSLNASTAISDSNVSIEEEVSDIRAAISNGDLGTGTVLESADVHATVADVADALEIYTGYDSSGVISELDNVVNSFELMEDGFGDIDSSLSFDDLSVIEAKSVYSADNANKIETISISDSFGAFDSEVSWLQANVNNNIHIEDVTLPQAKQLLSQEDTTYNGLSFSYDLHSTELSGVSFDNESVADAEAYINADNGPNPIEVSIEDSWSIIDNASSSFSCSRLCISNWSLYRQFNGY